MLGGWLLNKPYLSANSPLVVLGFLLTEQREWCTSGSFQRGGSFVNVCTLRWFEDTKELMQATVENIEGMGKEETYVDFEGNRQVARKKWFGIW